MYVEERNGHVVRRYLGYQRFDVEEAVQAVNALYDVLSLYLNHFKAVRRQVSRERVGSKYVRRYEKRAETPYQRVLSRADVAEEVKAELRYEHQTLNPLKLKHQIDILVASAYKLQRAAREQR